jgi:hypothetical protein
MQNQSVFSDLPQSGDRRNHNTLEQAKYQHGPAKRLENHCALDSIAQCINLLDQFQSTAFAMTVFAIGVLVRSFFLLDCKKL